MTFLAKFAGAVERNRSRLCIGLDPDPAWLAGAGVDVVAFNRGVIEILPPGAGQPDEADRQHLLEVAVASGRPVFFLGFDADMHGYVEKAAREGAQLYALLRAIPFNSRLSLKKTTYSPMVWRGRTVTLIRRPWLRRGCVRTACQ